MPPPPASCCVYVCAEMVLVCLGSSCVEYQLQNVFESLSVSIEINLERFMGTKIE